jgi:hypothetical protein
MPLPVPLDIEVTVDVSGPMTCPELGNSCLICDDPVEPGSTVYTAQAGGRRRSIHDDCLTAADRSGRGPITTDVQPFPQKTGERPGLRPLRCTSCGADAAVLVPLPRLGRLVYLCEPCWTHHTGEPS